MEPHICQNKRRQEHNENSGESKKVARPKVQCFRVDETFMYLPILRIITFNLFESKTKSRYKNKWLGRRYVSVFFFLVTNIYEKNN